MFKSGKAVVPTNGTGSAPDAAVTPGGVVVSFDGGSNKNRQSTLGLIVTNRELVAGNTLEISFNRGGDWFIIATNTTIEIPAVIHEVYLRGTTGAVALYSILGIK